MTDFTNPGADLGIPDAKPAGDRMPNLSRTVWASDGPEDAPAETFKADPMYRRPGSRSGLTVEVVDGQAVTTGDGDSLFGTPKTAPDAPTTTWSREPLKFHAPGTSTPVLARDVRSDTVVDLGGKIGEVSVGAAIHCGWLIDTGNGFERAGEAKAPPAPKRTATKAADPADADADTDADQADVEPSSKTAQEQSAPTREYLPHADEAYLRDIEKHVSPDLYAAVEASLIHGDGPLSDDLMARVASRFRGDRAAAEQVLAQAVQPFAQQAASTVENFVGPGNAERVFNWARGDKQGQALLKQAMADQVNERSTKGYAKVARAFLAAEAVRDPQGVLEGLQNGGARARIENGEVLVDLGRKHGGWTSFVAAMRSGLI